MVEEKMEVNATGGRRRANGKKPAVLSVEFAAFQSEILAAMSKNTAETAFEQLRRELLRTDSFWGRKARLLSVEAEEKFPLKKLKMLELELALHFRNAAEVVEAITFLRENHGEDADFQSHIERLTAALQAAKGTSFYEELNAKLDPRLFLDSLAGNGRNSALNRLQALITLANNPTVGLQKVGRSLFDEFLKNRSELMLNENEVSAFDLIWFHLHKQLYDAQLGDLGVEHGLSVYHFMLKCCAEDARSRLSEAHFSVCDQLGFARVRPRESWAACARVLVAVLLHKQQPAPSALTVHLKNRLDGLTFPQIAQQMAESFDLEADEEIARLLLSFVVGMREWYEGPGMNVVLLPGNLFKMSAHAISVFWTPNCKTSGSAEAEVELAGALGEHAEAYVETLTIARNVFAAYQKKNPAADTQIEPHLRELLANFQLPNAFAAIGQSMLVAGRFAEAAAFASLAVRATRDKAEQTHLCLQLLQANVGMRKSKQVFQMALELLGDEAAVREAVERSAGVFPPFRSFFDGFVRLPVDLTFHYVSLLLMHNSLVSFVGSKEDKRRQSLSGTLFVLCVQAAWEVACAQLDEAFDLVEGAFLVNCMTLLSNANVVARLFEQNVTFVQGNEIFPLANARKKFQTDGIKAGGRWTPFDELLRFIRSHESAFLEMFD
ncbi:hypothetical protein M3Y99_01209400 [Aphelenchoides fujianensis]|nr:hypothetical protein M3Y99_01209400 [Aphelenchoides fujianensis]